jgi:cardiolipin synthase
MFPDVAFVSLATLVGAIFIIWLVLVVFFTPGINYTVEARQDACSPEFSYKLVATSQAVFYGGNRIEVLTNGANFYPAMLEAIRGATESVNLECYIFQRGTIANQFVEALAERARAAVKVTIVADAIGSARLSSALVSRLREAGCRVEFYQPLRWYGLARLNNRTHRSPLPAVPA